MPPNKNQNKMKNVLKKSLLLSLFALFAISCIDTERTATNDADVWVFAREYDVGTPQLPWLYDKVGDLFYCDVRIPELTNQIYNEGMLAGYFVYYPVGNTQVNSPLPYSDFYMDDRGNQWSYQYTCEFSRGSVTFIFRDSNFAILSPPPCTFVIKMMR